MSKTPSLNVTLSSLKCQTPFVNASGPMGWFHEYLPLVDYHCLGAFVLKGLTKEPRTGTQNSRSYVEGSMLINAIGLENPGIDAFVRYRYPTLCKHKETLTKETWASDSAFPFVANINGIYEEEYAYLAQKLEDLSQINALEINLSCPNTEKGGLHFIQDIEAVTRIVRSVRSSSTKTLIAKLPYIDKTEPSFARILTLLKDEGIDIVSAINSVPSSNFDGKIAGGVSGVRIQKHAISMIRAIKEYIDIPIIGIGGLYSFDDLLRYFAAGARVLGIGTGLLYNIKIFSEMKQKTQELMLKENLQCMEELYEYAVTAVTKEAAHE